MKKGFTLIELLAVIVILAIIALIATPIIINIIENTRGESEKRSIELYASAVKNAMASYQLNHTNVPTSIDDLTVEYDGDVECSTSIIGKNGNVYLKDCTVNGNKVDYTYGSQFNTVCTLISGTDLTAGAKYSCQVNDTTGYNFYVLTPPSSESTTVNLIMDRNICEDGTPATETNSCEYDWLSNEDYLAAGGVVTDEMLNDGGPCQNGGICADSKYGPITAMTKVDLATSNWTNLKEITVSTFSDDSGTTHEMTQTFTTYARLPYYSEVSDYNKSLNNAYLYDNLHAGCYSESGETSCDVATHIEGVHEYGMSHTDDFGYWTLSYDPSDSYFITAFEVYYDGSKVNDFIATDSGSGIRPVITLEI